MASQDSEQHHSDRWYRDAVFVIPNNKVILTTAQADAARKTTQKNIVDEILSRDPDFRIIELDAYFEGGNVFYLPAHNVMLHGDHAQGHYIPHFNPREQTKAMTTQLATAGISVLGLELSQEALDANVPPFLDRGYFHAYYAYHLDCFMQTIPDGRVLLINAKILSPESLTKLKDLLGDKLVDLAYENYLTEPVLLNFLTVPFEDSFRIISNRLPDEIINKLQELGYSIITPQMFLPVLSTFHEGFNQSVIQNMRKLGYLEDFSDTSILVDPTVDNPIRDISILT